MTSTLSNPREKTVEAIHPTRKQLKLKLLLSPIKIKRKNRNLRVNGPPSSVSRRCSIRFEQRRKWEFEDRKELLMVEFSTGSCSLLRAPKI